MRGGAIIPILLHENALSVLRGINKPIKLEVYPNTENMAHGDLILDDGWSTKKDHSELHFDYASNVVSLKSGSISNFTSGKTISEV